MPALPGEVVPAPAVPAETLVEAQPAGDGLPPPAIGVEIVAMEERKGSRYFTIRDLRNGNTIQNVTLHSARKLWSYAINQYLTSPVDPARVQWDGDLGVVQVARRASACAMIWRCACPTAASACSTVSPPTE